MDLRGAKPALRKPELRERDRAAAFASLVFGQEDAMFPPFDEMPPPFDLMLIFLSSC